MALFLESVLLEMISALVLVMTILYIYFHWSWTYWKKFGVPQLEPRFPTGNFQEVLFLRKSIGDIFKDVYHSAKGNKFAGIYIFSRPMIMLRDPELIKAVLVKDFSHFQDRGFYDDSDREPLFGHLFILSGQKWRNLRTKICPAFTSGKLKMMFPTLVQTGMELIECLEKSAAHGEVIEVKDILARYSTDVISSCAFGIESNCLKDPDAEFRRWGRKIFAPTLGSTLYFIFTTLSPLVLNLAKLMSIKFLDPEVATYFKDMVEETVSYRENNNISRNDFMQLMIQLKNKGLLEADLDKEETKPLEKMSTDVNGGMRFGQLETKVGLVSILSHYSVQVSEKTPVPIVMDPKALVLSAAGGMWLKITKRNGKK